MPYTNEPVWKLYPTCADDEAGQCAGLFSPGERPRHQEACERMVVNMGPFPVAPAHSRDCQLERRILARRAMSALKSNCLRKYLSSSAGFDPIGDAWIS